MTKDIVKSDYERQNSNVRFDRSDEIMKKYIKTGVLKRWVNERPLIIPDKKINIWDIGLERKARNQILTAIKTDIGAEEWGYPKVVLTADPIVNAKPDYGIFGNPTAKADEIFDGVSELMNEGGLNVEFMQVTNAFRSVFEVPMGYQEVERPDSITDENIRIRVGRNLKGVFAEEIGTDNRCISRSEINTGNGKDYQYLLDLHFSGGRYKVCGGEIDITSDQLPRATVKTFELLLGVVKQGLKEKIVDVK